MTDSQPGTGARPEGAQALDPQELGAYFVLMEAVSLLQHQVEQQLRAEGGISYVQFQLLARLADATGPLTMTELADGVVYSRSGLTYQAGLLEKAGLITRGPSPDDDRATLVTFAAGAAGGVGDGDPLARPLVSRQAAPQVSAERLVVEVPAAVQLHRGGDRLPEPLVRQPEHRGVGHGGVPLEDLLDLLRVDL